MGTSIRAMILFGLVLSIAAAGAVPALSVEGLLRPVAGVLAVEEVSREVPLVEGCHEKGDRPAHGRVEIGRDALRLELALHVVCGVIQDVCEGALGDDGVHRGACSWRWSRFEARERAALNPALFPQAIRALDVEIVGRVLGTPGEYIYAASGTLQIVSTALPG